MTDEEVEVVARAIEDAKAAFTLELHGFNYGEEHCIRTRLGAVVASSRSELAIRTRFDSLVRDHIARSAITALDAFRKEKVG